MMELLHDAGIWVLISFVLFAVFAYRLGRVPFLAKLDDRIDDIRKEIEAAESLRVEAQELLAQYQRKQRDATEEAARIVETARKHAASIQEKAEEELSQSIARREQQLSERLHRMEQSAVASIRAHAAQLAMQSAHDLLRERMTKKTAGNLVDQSIQNIAAGK
ncbi:MAG: hypothetical protein KDJ15_05020 [Alphaproteobacteria bacterium]|nr:hypothetical protein [Alphaproteobacteria bacterium]